ncbi:phosphoribosylaminoimidazole-succinocarboxamide synthase [Mycena rebaudengoi]|nr:phosphoribosylaminoimidazole-succinocarboxamide synthase [Mycena rebaudengoi]
MTCLTHTDLPHLTLVSKGKVRDIYSTSDPDTLLFVATDRISAYDVILNNGIPDKGKLLTEISLFWFQKLEHIIPNHFVTANVHEMPEEVHEYEAQLAGRSMLVKKAQVVPLEAIVRSAWSEYQKSGTVHGIALPAGLIESEKLPTPLFTPSTKAEQGSHDENISPEQASELIGPDLYAKIRDAALALYASASTHAHSKGIILADTKFEFGLFPLSPAPGTTQELILIDELLTPDSSRYWPLQGIHWLVSSGFRKGLEAGPEGSAAAGWLIDSDVVHGTQNRYREVVAILTT